MKLVPNSNGVIDLGRSSAGLLKETTLESAVIISLLTDRRAAIDDRPPETTSGVIPPDRRGWCGDALADVPGDRIGSRLWLLYREKVTEETRRRAISYAKEALEWMLSDGVAAAVEIEAEWNTQDGLPGRLDMLVGVTDAEGNRHNFKIQTPIGV